MFNINKTVDLTTDKTFKGYLTTNITWKDKILLKLVFNFSHSMYDVYHTKLSIWTNLIHQTLQDVENDTNISIDSLHIQNYIFSQVQGGGKNSQLTSSLNAINYVLFKYLINLNDISIYSKQIKSIFKKYNLLERDIRQEESKKYGYTKARRPQQWSMR